MNNHHSQQEIPFSPKDTQELRPCYLYLVLPAYNEEELLERWFEDDLFFEDGRKFDGIYEDAA